MVQGAVLSGTGWFSRIFHEWKIDCRLLDKLGAVGINERKGSQIKKVGAPCENARITVERRLAYVVAVSKGI